MITRAAVLATVAVLGVFPVAPAMAQGVPPMVFDGEPFFGQDRFDQMKWRMGQKGLAKR